MFRKTTTILSSIYIMYTFVTPPNVKAESLSQTSEEIVFGSNCPVSSQEILLLSPVGAVSFPFQRLDDLGITLGIPDETAALSCAAVLSIELGQDTPSSIEPIDIGYEIVFGNGERQECSINSLSVDSVGALGPSTIQVLRTAPQQGTNTYTVSNHISLGFGASESVTITPCARASNKVLARRNFVIRAVPIERQAACLIVQCPLQPRPRPPPPPPPPVP
jgi:hypothetical protein